MADKKAQLLEAVRASGEALVAEISSFVDDECLGRYLAARGHDVKKAAAMLGATLRWRREVDPDNMTIQEHAEFIGQGQLYLAASTSCEGHPVLMSRKRQSPLAESQYDPYLRYTAFVLNSAVRAMAPGGPKRWVWLMDMGTYSSANSPSLSMSRKFIAIVAQHFPERLHKLYIIDAPTLFWVLWKAVSPFVDPVTAAKIEFAYTKDYQKTEADEWVAKTPAAAKSQFGSYIPFLKQPFDESAFRQLLQQLGWRER